MGARKSKAVFSADPEQMKKVELLVKEGSYRSPSEFVREAISEKLVRLQQARLARQVERLCAGGGAGDGVDLIEWQAFEDV